MEGAKNVRIRADLAPQIEARAARVGSSLNAYVSDVLKAHLQPGEWQRGIPLGLSELADVLEHSVSLDTIWIVLFGGLPPRMTLAAGSIVDMGPTHLRMHLVESDQRVLIPRIELTAFWAVRHQDHPVPEIRDALVESQASSLYVHHLL